MRTVFASGWDGRKLIENRPGEISWEIIMLYTLTEIGGYTWVYALVNTQGIYKLRSVYLIVYKFYLTKIYWILVNDMHKKVVKGKYADICNFFEMCQIRWIDGYEVKQVKLQRYNPDSGYMCFHCKIGSMLLYIQIFWSPYNDWQSSSPPPPLRHRLLAFFTLPIQLQLNCLLAVLEYGKHNPTTEWWLWMFLPGIPIRLTHPHSCLKGLWEDFPDHPV